MNYEIKYLDDKKIVRVKIQGRLNFSLVQKYSVEALKLARGNNCSKFLLDHTGSLLEAGVYKLHTDGDTMEQFGFKSNDKIAVVISVDHSPAHIWNARKSNVKFSNIQYFNSIDESVKWLLED